MSARRPVVNPPITPPIIKDMFEALRVRHPATDAAFFTFFTRRVYDPAGTALINNEFSLPASLVIDACRIVSQQYDESMTFLSSSSDPSQAPFNGAILPSGDYYFHVRDCANYPFCPNFDSWRVLRRQEVPGKWFSAAHPQTTLLQWPTASWATIHGSQSEVSGNAKGIDGRCTMCGRTGGDKYIQSAHVVPRALAGWYLRHAIWERLHYAMVLPTKLDPTNAVNDIRNVIAMSAECLEAWDAYDFVHFPVDGTMGTVYITGTTYDDAIRYHMRTFVLPERADPFLFFLRFVYVAFKKLTLGQHQSCLGTAPKRTAKARAGASSVGSGVSTPSGIVMSAPSASEEHLPHQEMDIDQFASGRRSFEEDMHDLAKKMIDMGWDIPEDLKTVLNPESEEERQGLSELVCKWRAEHPNISQQSGCDDI